MNGNETKQQHIENLYTFYKDFLVPFSSAFVFSLVLPQYLFAAKARKRTAYEPYMSSPARKLSSVTSHNLPSYENGGW